MKYRLLAGIIALGLAGASWAETHLATRGNLEMLVEALPSTSLNSETARVYKVDPDPSRGLLTVRIMKKNGIQGPLPAQVYAGAMTQGNLLLSIPLREVREDKAVYYLGEYRITPPDQLRFLVNANVLGTPLKVEFSRDFPRN